MGENGSQLSRKVVALSPSDLMRMPWDDACAAKWSAGREIYGEEWQGDHPAFEAFCEFVDGRNYIDEWQDRGEISDALAAKLRRQIKTLAQEIRRAALNLRNPPTPG